MPVLAPTTDRLVAIRATLGVSPRLIGTWLAARTAVAGVIVVVSDGGRLRYTYSGSVQWWLQLKVPCMLRFDGQTSTVRVLGHRAAPNLVEVELSAAEPHLATADHDRARLAEQDRLDAELAAYWSSHPHGPADVAAPHQLHAIGAALDAAPVPMYMLGPAGTYVGANRAYLDRARRRLDEVVGSSPERVWSDGRVRPAPAHQRSLDVPGIGSAVIGTLPLGPGVPLRAEGSTR